MITEATSSRLSNRETGAESSILDSFPLCWLVGHNDDVQQSINFPFWAVIPPE